MEKGSLDHVDIFPTNLFPAVHNTTLLCVLLVIIPQLVYSETLLWFRIDNCTNITHSLFSLDTKEIRAERPHGMHIYFGLHQYFPAVVATGSLTVVLM